MLIFKVFNIVNTKYTIENDDWKISLRYICSTNIIIMLNTILITIVIIAIAVLLLGIKVFFIDGGKFPSMHISANKEMKRRGITCAMSTDAQDRNRKSLNDYIEQESN
jgi:hypothetical protein